MTTNRNLTVITWFPPDDMQSPYQDDKVAEEESESFIPNQQARKREFLGSRTAIICTLLLAAILGFLTSSAWAWFEQRPRSTLHCGSNVAEAQALGCEFDLLAAGWVPKPCLDRTSNTEFMAWALSPDRKRSPFPYFFDSLGQHRIGGLEALSKHNGTVFTTSEEHLGHCSQQGKRAHRAAVTGGRVGGINVGEKPLSGVISNPHMAHCTKMLWQYVEKGWKEIGGDSGALGTQFEVGFWTC